MSLLVGRNELENMNRFDVTRYDTSEVSPFYSSFPPPVLMRNHPNSMYDRRMDYIDNNVWKDRKEERKVNSKYSDFSPKYFPRHTDMYDRDRKLEFQNYKDSFDREKAWKPGMLELDLTSAHARHTSEEHSPISPSEYFYRRRDILSNGGSSHSTSPVSPFAGDHVTGRAKHSVRSSYSGGQLSPWVSDVEGTMVVN